MEHHANQIEILMPSYLFGDMNFTSLEELYKNKYYWEEIIIESLLRYPTKERMR